MASLEQECARYAWEKVRTLDADILERYKKLAKSMPALVMTNGLMQTLAFLKGKGKEEKRRGKKEKEADRSEHYELLQHIVGWLWNTGVVPVQQANFASVMGWWASGDCTTLHYQQATEQALNVLRWIRYFADALDARAES